MYNACHRANGNRIMFRHTFHVSIIAVLLFSIVANAQPAATKLSDAEITQLLSAIRPSEGEDPFATIPWQTNLWDARQLAAKEGKPILLWEMDGHPLGCV